MSQDEPKSKKLKSDTTQNDLVSQFADQRKQVLYFANQKHENSIQICFILDSRKYFKVQI